MQLHPSPGAYCLNFLPSTHNAISVPILEQAGKNSLNWRKCLEGEIFIQVGIANRPEKVYTKMYSRV